MTPGGFHVLAVSATDNLWMATHDLENPQSQNLRVLERLMSITVHDDDQVTGQPELWTPRQICLQSVDPLRRLVSFNEYFRIPGF